MDETCTTQYMDGGFIDVADKDGNDDGAETTVKTEKMERRRRKMNRRGG